MEKLSRARVNRVRGLTKKQRKAIGDRVRSAREDLARLTMREVAAEVGVSTTTVFSWEQGTCVPETAERRAKLADVLGVEERLLFREVYQAIEVREQRARARLLAEPA